MANNGKLGRNAPCPCGSGMKYKKCCLTKNRKSEHQLDTYSIDQEIKEAMMLSLDFNQNSIIASIDKLKRLSELPNLTLL
jgi:hypothetical protein